MKAMHALQSVSKDPHEYARTIKRETAKPVLGYFCSYTPEEIIHAAGAVPYRRVSATSCSANAGPRRS